MIFLQKHLGGRIYTNSASDQGIRMLPSFRSTSGYSLLVLVHEEWNHRYARKIRLKEEEVRWLAEWNIANAHVDNIT